jgi:NAD-dependent deacetylase
MAPMTPLPIDSKSHVLVLTGAGISAESGVPTFRDSRGLWESHRVEEVASPEGFAKDAMRVWRFYSQRRQGAAQARPNPGHLALVELERRLGERFLLVTQNVDGLHREAGSQRLVELHGHLFTSRCERCERPPFEDRNTYLSGECPRCGECGTGRIRPHIVWFGEMLEPADNGALFHHFIRGAAGHVLPQLLQGR